MRKIIPFVYILLFYSCRTTNDISGLYRQKFLSIGFFKAAVKLNKDLTFEYTWSGDMQYDKGFGTYTLKDRIITLKYIPSHYDTLTETFTSFKPIFKRENGLILHASDSTIHWTTKEYLDYRVDNRPQSYYYKNNRLYYIMPDKTINHKKDWVYSDRKKYILFGSHYYYRNNELTKTK